MKYHYICIKYPGLTGEFTKKQSWKYCSATILLKQLSNRKS